MGMFDSTVSDLIENYQALVCVGTSSCSSSISMTPLHGKSVPSP
jgi:hypothetical protein